MQKFHKVFMLTMTVILFAACGKSGLKNLRGVKMDTEDAVEQAKEIAEDNIKPDQWKIISVTWSEGSGNKELSNEATTFTYELVDKAGRVWSQSFTAENGWEASKPTDAGWDKWHKNLNPKDVPGIDIANINAAEVIRNINAAKKLIPAEYEFRSTHSYTMNTYDDPKVSVKLNVVERGSGYSANNGQASTVFYELDFRKNAKGKMELVKP